MNINSSLIFYLAVLIFALASCRYDGNWQINNSKNVSAPEVSAMPLELLEENVRTTDLTAVVKVNRAKISGKPLWPFNASGYVEHIYEAKVIETIKGRPLEQVTYSVMAEADAEIIIPNYPVVVSLCEANDGVFHTPDNGYVSAAPTVLIKGIKTKSEQFNDSTKHISACRH